MTTMVCVELRMIIFVGLFLVNGGVYEQVLEFIHPCVSAEDNIQLMAPFTKDEFREVIFQMHIDKSSSPDIFNLAFYQ